MKCLLSKSICSNFTKKAFAFTLAETLIVMGVIGIVSALTLPNLNSSTGDKEKVAKVKKIYQNLTDAYTRAEVVYGPYDEWFKNDNTYDKQATRAGERVLDFMKTSKVCGLKNGCWCSSRDFGNGAPYRFLTADGMSVSIQGQADDNDIYVDIDGPTKGPCQVGKDVFYFGINNNPPDGIIRPDGFAYTSCDTFAKILAAVPGSCSTTWIINYDNMDYLKLKNSKCPNDTTPTESNPRCK